MAGAVRRIDDHGQMRQAMNGRNDRKIDRVAGVIGKGADAAFAEDHVVIALGHDVFGGEQQFIQRRRQAAF